MTSLLVDKSVFPFHFVLDAKNLAGRLTDYPTVLSFLYSVRLLYSLESRGRPLLWRFIFWDLCR